MQQKQPLGKTFLALSALNAYGVWVILFLFPLVLAAVIRVIDVRRNIDSLLLSAMAIAIIAVSYMLRFYLVRNSASLRTRLLQTEDSEQAMNIISGGVCWWLVTLICSISAVIFYSHLF